jgi:3-oxoacyl-(acyl-carrier-protein) synthase
VGVIVGSAASVVENDDAFDLRLREQGVRAAEPRRFPATSPNVPAGQCAIAFGLRGPAFAVGAGPEAPFEALLVAWDLLASGDADALLVIAAEDVGPAVTSIWTAAGYPLPAPGALAALLTRGDGPGIAREEVVRLWDRARSGKGRLGDLAPGWPAFQGGLLGLNR